MHAKNAETQEFWWTGDSSEKYWLEQLRTDEYGDRLIAPDNGKYAAMRGVEVGDLVFHWYSERHPGAGAGRSGIFAASRAIGEARSSRALWEGQACLEVPLTPRTLLRRPILLRDLKDLESGFKLNRDRLVSSIDSRSSHSPWQFPKTGLKPVVRYLTKLSSIDLELIIASHPSLATTIDCS